MGKAKLILLVDDDRDFLEQNRGVLAASGYRVSCFSNPQEALQAAEREPPDLVVSDLMMKALDSGFTLAREAKARFPRVPVILVTAAASQRGFNFSPRGPEDLAAMNADAFFDKPVAPDQLIAKVRDLLA
jgi:two-component system alkaline phosphatase synthesis response regulator PhoP